MTAPNFFSTIRELVLCDRFLRLRRRLQLRCRFLHFRLDFHRSQDCIQSSQHLVGIHFSRQSIFVLGSYAHLQFVAGSVRETDEVPNFFGCSASAAIRFEPLEAQCR